jgi:hypothetical protein
MASSAIQIKRSSFATKLDANQHESSCFRFGEQPLAEWYSGNYLIDSTNSIPTDYFSGTSAEEQHPRQFKPGTCSFFTKLDADRGVSNSFFCF